MQFSVRLTGYQENTMLNICDVDLVGKKISENNLQVDISKNYYGKEIVEKNEAENLLKNSSIINMVGKEIISLSMNLGIGSEKGIKKISGVPFLIVYKI
ncbi:MAG: hypothetical protein NPMRTHETA2_370006 [Nitrosopumilales archaeon]|nr:MAG: hypothetical protein NPMRTHETA2_370006 [Nitrosopumilales archaeon]